LDGNGLFVVRDSTLQTGDVASRLWLVTFDGVGFAPVSPAVMDAGKGPLRIVGPLDVTPDGATIVFAALDLGGTQALYVIRRDGTGLQQLTPGPTDWAPVIAPDGQRVAFLRDASCSVDYWIANVDGSGEQRLSGEGLCGLDPEPLGHDWSPDGKDLVLAGTDASLNVLIFRIPAGSTNYALDRVLVGRGVDAGGVVRDGQPSWRP
jgi:dipeptidyl aminopeptidase/acylaminoacyl peptidase